MKPEILRSINLDGEKSENSKPCNTWVKPPYLLWIVEKIKALESSKMTKCLACDYVPIKQSISIFVLLC